MARYTFSLETAIESWRRALEGNRVFLTDDLDELERHPRDQVQDHMLQGATPEAAFRNAVRDIGSYDDVESEYGKVFLGKMTRSGNLKEEITWRLSMVRNFGLVALRNIRRRPGYSAINVLGLAVGLACFIAIGLYTLRETSFDSFHGASDSIYRIIWDFEWENGQGTAPATPPPLADKLTSGVPGVQAAVRLYPVSRMTVRRGDTYIAEDRILAADSNFFSVFDFELVRGDPQTALTRPNSVILTEERARAYFDDEPALGKQLIIGEDSEFLGRPYSSTFTVTGVAEAPPAQTHIQFDFLTSSASHPQIEYFDWSWIWMQMATYVQLEDGADPAAIEQNIPPIVRANAPAAFSRIGFSFEELIESGGKYDFLLEPLPDVYLGPVGNIVGPSGNRAYVLAFAGIGVLVLLMACVNFMNLATARSAHRALEIGVRKVLGSRRGTLIGQFLAESVTYCLIALPIAAALVAASAGAFEQISGVRLDLAALFSPAALFSLTGLLVFVGLLSGSYPGLYLSSFRPVRVLNGNDTAGGGNRHLRRGLVVFQFTLTIALIAATLLVYRQMSYLQERDLGFDRAGILTISNENDRLGGRAEVLRSRLEARADIESASISTHVPLHCCFQDFYKAEGRGDEQYSLTSYLTDAYFLETMGIELVAGRGFEPGRTEDASSVVLNESAVEAFGWSEPIGKTIRYGGSGEFTVIGVMEDFNLYSLKFPVAPFALFHERSEAYQIPDSYLIVRSGGDDPDRLVEQVRAEWADVAPGTPFEYEFVGESFRQSYESESRMGRLLVAFSGLAIFIACLGLLGLAAYAVERRTREVGIRKAFGASSGSIVALMSREFVALVAVSFVLAAPLAFLAVRSWLSAFAYRMDIGLLPFIAGGVLALVLALAATGYHALRAASMSPVRALKRD